MSEQSIFTLKDSDPLDDEGKKISISDQLKATQRRSGRFVLFVMMVHPYQADPNYKHSCMNRSARVQILLDLDGIDASIDTQKMKNSILF